MCDLMISKKQLLTPVKNQPGETVKFTFTITNVGEGIAEGSWYDSVYLSRYPTHIPRDKKLLTTISLTNTLKFNESYVKMYELKLPFSLSPGSYYIVMETDSSKYLFDSNRNNNEAFLEINLLFSGITDIFITNVTVNHVDQKRLDFSWLMSGTTALKGLKCDNHYLSRDAFWTMENFEISSGKCEALK